MVQRDILIDVSRLIWRFWRGGLPTGIDRVCLAYIEHFRSRSQAVIHGSGRYYVLSNSHSDLLFELFSRGWRGFRRQFVQLAIRALPEAQRRVRNGSIYLNIGHTGLDGRSLTRWIAGNDLRAVFFVHDLIPLLYPEYCRPGEEARHQRRMENVLRSARGLIGNSHATIEDLAGFATMHGLRMPPAIAAWIAGPPLPVDITPKRFDRPHFIAVGTIEARKNYSLLLHVWKRFVANRRERAPLLVIVGQRGWEASHAIGMLDRAADLKGHVLELGKCEDDELAGLIAGARALLMPSFAEGFGLPVAEALQLGTPVIASDLPTFHEFASEIPTYLDPIDGIAWETTIMSFTGDSLERERQRQALKAYRAPDWPRHFKVVEQWLETLP